MASLHHDHHQTNLHRGEKTTQEILTLQKPFILTDGNTKYNIGSELIITKMTLTRGKSSK